MKWFELAKKLLPGIELVLSAAVPGAAAVIPFINAAIVDAQAVHGDSNNAAKKQLVYDAAAAAAATGKVQLDPVLVQQITACVFSTIDNVHTVVKQNQPPPTPAL